MLADLTGDQNLCVPTSTVDSIPEQNESSLHLVPDDVPALTKKQPELIKDALYYMDTVIFKVDMRDITPSHI